MRSTSPLSSGGVGTNCCQNDDIGLDGESTSESAESKLVRGSLRFINSLQQYYITLEWMLLPSSMLMAFALECAVKVLSGYSEFVLAWPIFCTIELLILYSAVHFCFNKAICL